MHVCQRLQMSTLCIRSVSCHARSIYHAGGEKRLCAGNRREREKEERQGWRLLTWPRPTLQLLLLLLGRAAWRHLEDVEKEGARERREGEEPLGRGSRRLEKEYSSSGCRQELLFTLSFCQDLWGVLDEQSRAARNEIPVDEEEGDSNGLTEAKTTKFWGARLTEIVCHNSSFKLLRAGNQRANRRAVHRSTQTQANG